MVGLLWAVCGYAANIPGTVVAAKITTGNTANIFSIGDTDEMGGTPKQVADITARDAIPAARRTEGMTCWVLSENAEYRLVGGVANANWTQAAFLTNTVTLYATNAYVEYFTNNYAIITNIYVTNSYVLYETNSYLYTTNLFATNTYVNYLTNNYLYTTNLYATNVFVEYLTNNFLFTTNLYTTNAYVLYETNSYLFTTNLFTTNALILYETNNYTFTTNLFTTNALILYETNSYLFTTNLYTTNAYVLYFTNSWGYITNVIIEHLTGVIGYIVLASPFSCDGVGGILYTNDNTKSYFGQCQFSHSADQSANYCSYYITVPDDFDNTIDWKVARLKFQLGGADTGTHRYVISMSSVADSAAYDGSLGNAINLDFAGDASGAGGDVETVSGVTLTNWKSNMTAGQLLVIRLARDGDAAEDASTVNSYSGPIVLSYGVKQ